MPISLSYLPSELHYIVPLAERHGSEARIHRYDRRLGRHVQYAETLSAEDVESLRELYDQISVKGHGPLINRWHQSNCCKGTCPPETTWPVYGLLCLFAQLAGLGVAPFSDGKVCPQEGDWPRVKTEAESAWTTEAQRTRRECNDGRPSRRSGKRFGLLTNCSVEIMRDGIPQRAWNGIPETCRGPC